ncbi:SDR family NAD(P)-dependent oxidoreductase [Gracilimonas sp.]|uniref:SDR family NAD(P)-dependent oxidoreductase n=1 Tax=Gracilimonas sp. TaxID=1974203 RepID=UPI002870C9D4|nr:SDR family oxidoreductase [Gracilimonas sp.]
MSNTIVVTGASRGIGFQTVLKLASQNHTVIATARSAEKLKKLKEKAVPGRVITIAADLTSEQDLKKLSDIFEKFDHIDGIVNNAGAFHKGSLLETDIEVFQKLMDVNVFGIVRLTKAAKPKLKSGSHILNISSMSGYQGSKKFGGLSAYGASKAAVVGLSEVLSAEFAEDGIAVNCLCIGAVQTEMFEDAFPGFEAPVQPEQMGAYIADFILNGHQFYNGKVLPVALNDPS